MDGQANAGAGAPRTPGTWRCRPASRHGDEGYVVESELPCVNGLSAWFEVAFVHGRDRASIGMSDGALAAARDDAMAIVAAINGMRNA